MAPISQTEKSVWARKLSHSKKTPCRNPQTYSEQTSKTVKVSERKLLMASHFGLNWKRTAEQNKIEFSEKN